MHVLDTKRCVRSPPSPRGQRRRRGDAARAAPDRAARGGSWRWSVPHTSGAHPTARSSHSMTVVGDRAVMFGGIGTPPDNLPNENRATVRPRPPWHT
jgi:hypothetical protein